jgi:DNA-binding transcriptional LysR family regulator
MKNNVSIDDLRYFLAVLEEGGFRAAAKRLGVAPSHVSTTVTRIESDLGVPLLLRSTRSVRATEEGLRFAAKLRPHLADINAAVSELSNSAGQVRGRLKLNVPGAVVPDILPPILAAFQSRHPNVEVEIVIDNDLVDIIASGCDAGIRYGASLAKDVVSVPIGPRAQTFALAASPAYLEARGRPRVPRDLAEHDAIRFRLSEGGLLVWKLHHAAETIAVEPMTRLVLSVNAMNAALGYARTGTGIIGVFRNWLEDDFRAGTLLPVLSECWTTLDGPRLYYPSRMTSAPLRAFIEVCRTQ